MGQTYERLRKRSYRKYRRWVDFLEEHGGLMEVLLQFPDLEGVPEPWTILDHESYITGVREALNEASEVW